MRTLDENEMSQVNGAGLIDYVVGKVIEAVVERVKQELQPIENGDSLSRHFFD